MSMSGDREFGESGTRLWLAVTSTREVSKAHETMLEHACHVADRLDQIVIELDGQPLRIDVYDRSGMKINEVANPLLAEHRQQMLMFKQILSGLGIEKLEQQQTGPSFADALAAAKLKVVK